MTCFILGPWLARFTLHLHIIWSCYVEIHPSTSDCFLWSVYRVSPVRTWLMPIWINVLLDHLVLHWAIGNSSYPTSGSADLVLIFVASGRGILSVRQFLSYSTSCFWSSFSGVGNWLSYESFCSLVQFLSLSFPFWQTLSHWVCLCSALAFRIPWHYSFWVRGSHVLLVTPYSGLILTDSFLRLLIFPTPL